MQDGVESRSPTTLGGRPAGRRFRALSKLAERTGLTVNTVKATGRHPLAGRLPAWLAFKPGLARRKIAGLNPLSTGTCGCVTAEVDYQVPSAAGESRRCRLAAIWRTAAGLSRDALLLSSPCALGLSRRLRTPPRRGLMPTEGAEPLVAAHQRRMLEIGAGGGRGVHPLASTVAPDRQPVLTHRLFIVYD